MVAYRLFARGQACREQRPVTLYSLRQKVWSFVVLSLKEQKSVPMMLQTRSSVVGVSDFKSQGHFSTFWSLDFGEARDAPEAMISEVCVRIGG